LSNQPMVFGNRRNTVMLVGALRVLFHQAIV
jgi:hypothetical protein